ncbi:MAG TPA: sugar ABC transporter permease [Candidatus Hydrogenedentes bacterium]|nr:sugar ABC transporter permease [Candidatus Hydrogenedentota bacterium]HOL78049.1 sugar ABC transporter permease [Candidatus Hydrogenedentota bacterium]HPO84591.1 sugar ABC transporter permease [Candidatus Hydrogenedentota bacterium]
MRNESDFYLGVGHRVRQAAICYAILIPSLLLLTVFVYVPVTWAFIGSLFRFEVGGASEFVGLDNFVDFLFKDPVTWPAFGNMIFLTFFAVCVRLTVPLVVAKFIHSVPKERYRYFYRIVFLIPIVVPGVAIQLIWGGLVYAEHGIVNETLRALGLESWTQGWLSNPQTALFAVACIGFPFVGGFDVLIYYAGLSNIPESVHEAAWLEGCSGVKKFFLIDIPMVMSQLKLILILTIIGGFQGFEGLFILTRGGPGFKTTVPGLWMYLNAFSFQRMGYACAIGVVLFVLIFGLTLLNFRYFKSTEQLESGS